jgi:hypothetical protein
MKGAPMDERDIVNKVRKAKEYFGPDCPKKFGGAAAVEILRAALNNEGIATSRRDVFVRGVSVEVDLIIPHSEEEPFMELLYDPHQVAVALEVKKAGIFGKAGLDSIRQNFDRLRAKGIRRCAYFTFEERRNYKWKGTPENLCCPCFTLAWQKNTDGPFEPTCDWKRFVTFLRKAIAV